MGTVDLGILTHIITKKEGVKKNGRKSNATSNE